LPEGNSDENATASDLREQRQFSDHCRPSDGILIPEAGPLMNPLRPFMLPEKLLAKHYVSHGWLAGTLAVPFVLLAAALWRSGTLSGWFASRQRFAEGMVESRRAGDHCTIYSRRSCNNGDQGEGTSFAGEARKRRDHFVYWAHYDFCN
jgi:hypothetical protein